MVRFPVPAARLLLGLSLCALVVTIAGWHQAAPSEPDDLQWVDAPIHSGLDLSSLRGVRVELTVPSRSPRAVDVDGVPVTILSVEPGRYSDGTLAALVTCELPRQHLTAIVARAPGLSDSVELLANERTARIVDTVSFERPEPVHLRVPVPLPSPLGVEVPTSGPIVLLEAAWQGDDLQVQCLAPSPVGVRAPPSTQSTRYTPREPNGQVQHVFHFDPEQAETLRAAGEVQIELRPAGIGELEDNPRDFRFELLRVRVP